MNHAEEFLDCHLLVNYEINANAFRGIKVFVHVTPKNAKDEDDFLFTEVTSITDIAIRIKYGSFDSNPLPDIEKLTIQKAKTRILLDFYEQKKDYIQEITSKKIDPEFSPLPDEIIQLRLLIGLNNLRKKRPLTYTVETVDLDGFCLLLGVDINQVFYNATLLIEDELIQIGPTKEHSLTKGGIFVTSAGVKEIKFLHEQMTSPQIRTGFGDPFEAKGLKTVYDYDVAFSFAGEDRKLAEQIAKKLIEKGIRVFYDEFELANLWGKDLYEYLSKIYNESAKYCVMFLSKAYSSKMWTNHERKSAQTRAFRERNEYILPIRIDDTKIPGINETVGYIQYDKHSVDDIVSLIISKINSIQ